MKSSRIIVMLAFTLMFASGCLVAKKDTTVADASLRIDNDSSYALYGIYITPTNVDSWGLDWLGADILYPGDSITINLDCDYYDVKMVDEDGVECEVYDVDLCYNDTAWSITNTYLDSCF